MGVLWVFGLITRISCFFGEFRLRFFDFKSIEAGFVGFDGAGSFYHEAHERLEEQMKWEVVILCCCFWWLRV